VKILHVVRNLDRYSGAAYQALNLARHQAHAGLDVSILNVSDNPCPDNWQGNSIKIYDSKKNGSFFLLSKLLFAHDIVHFHGMFLREMIFAKMLGCRVLLKTTLLGEDDFDSLLLRPFGKLRLAIINWATDLNNALSTPIRKVNLKHLQSFKVMAVPNFVSENPHVIGCVKENIVVYVGAILSRKKVLEAIELFENNIQPSGYRMIVIGPCDIVEDKIDLEYVGRFKEKLAQNPSLIYLGKLEQEEVLYILARSKSLIFLSDKEGMPNVVLEALAANCFVITSSISGVAIDIYEHGIQGFNVDSGDTLDCKDMEESVAKELPLKLAEEKFYFSRNIEIYEKIYKEMSIG